MTNLPIPFVVAFLLVLLAMTNHHAMKATATGRVFLQMIYLHALSMVIIGLRWSLDMVFLLPAAAVLAVVTSAMLYLAFCSLGRVGPVISPRRDWPQDNQGHEAAQGVIKPGLSFLLRQVLTRPACMWGFSSTQPSMKPCRRRR